MNEVLTPGVSVAQDEFDNTAIVRQPPVSASSSMGEGPHLLGFSWYEKSPDTVYLTVSKLGILNIEGVQFMVDGEPLEPIRKASRLTDYGRSTDRKSSRRFATTFSAFERLANAQDVRMRVESIDTYSVSKFGPANGIAVINEKFGKFLAEVNE